MTLRIVFHNVADTLCDNHSRDSIVLAFKYLNEHFDQRGPFFISKRLSTVCRMVTSDFLTKSLNLTFEMFCALVHIEQGNKCRSAF